MLPSPRARTAAGRAPDETGGMTQADDQPGSHETLIDLPSFVDGEFDVYVNGIAQQRGTDYELLDRTLVFQRELAPEVKMNRVQWVLVGIGIGSYRKHDSVDILYERDGRKLVATGLQPRAAEGS